MRQLDLGVCPINASLRHRRSDALIGYYGLRLPAGRQGLRMQFISPKAGDCGFNYRLIPDLSVHLNAYIQELDNLGY
jgi:hypothetical protein